MDGRIKQKFSLQKPKLKMIQGNAVNVNKYKVSDTELTLSSQHLLFDKFLLIQKSKKNYFLVVVG